MDNAPRPLPEYFRIPDQLLKDWVRLPLDQPLTTPITKLVLEHLFFAIDKVIKSQEHLQRCLIEVSNGRTDEGNAALVASQHELIEAQNRARQFLMEIIVSATRAP